MKSEIIYSSDICPGGASVVLRHNVTGWARLFKISQRNGNCYSDTDIMLQTLNGDFATIFSGSFIPGVVNIDYIDSDKKRAEQVKNNIDACIAYIDVLYP